MKKIIINSALSICLVATTLTSLFVVDSLVKKESDDPISVETTSRGIVVKKLKSTTNDNGSTTQTFAFSVEPMDATSDLVNVSVSYFDGTSCDDVVNAIVDNDNNTISVTCLSAFSKQVILTISSVSDPNVSALVNIDYLQRWPVADNIESVNYDNPFMIGEELNGTDVNYFKDNIVDFNSLFELDYGTFSKAKEYSYYGIEVSGNFYGLVNDPSHVISYQLQNQMIDAAWDLLLSMNNNKISWTPDLIWNLIDSKEYQTALYNSMLSYDYQNEGSYIEFLVEDFSLVYSDGETTKVIGSLQYVSFRINICADYSSFATPVDSVDFQMDSIIF